VAEQNGYPVFSDAEFAHRFAAVRSKMDERAIEALLLYGAGRSAEIRYLSNWPGTREAFLLFPREGEPTLLVQLYNHVPNARRTAITQDVRWAGARSVETVIASLREMGLGGGRLGLVGPWTWREADALRGAFPHAELADASDLLRDLRTIKSEEELAMLRTAAGFTDLAMRALEREVRAGMREHELATIVEASYGREGGTHGIHFMATTPMRDPRIGVPSQLQSSRIIEKGDVLITEISAEHWGYAGQLHRAYAIGEEPTDAYRGLHDVAVEAYERIRDALRDGATVGKVLDAAEVLHERGYTIYDDLLHGASQLPPIIQTRRTKRAPWREDFTFRQDMVVVVQPNVVKDDERMGLQVGETLRITRTGVERLHDYPLRFVVTGA
jgi:Xaa-Pro aminopeptidase